MSDLADLIDRVMATGKWRSIMIHENLSSLIIKGDLSTASPDQMGAVDALPSQRLRDLLEMHLQEGRWARTAAPVEQESDFGDLF